VGLVVGGVLLAGGAGALSGAYAYLAGALARVISAAWWSRDQWARSTDRASIAAQAAHPLSRPFALLKESTPLALSSIFIALYFRVDSVILRAMQGERAVGLYAGIYRMFETFVLFAMTFRSVMFPVLSRAADDPER